MLQYLAGPCCSTLGVMAGYQAVVGSSCVSS